MAVHLMISQESKPMSIPKKKKTSIIVLETDRELQIKVRLLCLGFSSDCFVSLRLQTAGLPEPTSPPVEKPGVHSAMEFELVQIKAQTNVLLALTNVLFLKANILEGSLNILFPVV